MNTSHIGVDTAENEPVNVWYAVHVILFGAQSIYCSKNRSGGQGEYDVPKQSMPVGILREDSGHV